MLARRSGRGYLSIVALSILILSAGCTSVPDRYTVSPSMFPNGLHGGPRSSRVPINYLRLRQDPPAVYILGPRDTLGVYIEGVLGSRDEPLPVQFADQKDVTQQGLPPAIGYPVPIREDGTLPLPLVPPIHAEGLTLPQLESVIRRAYTVDHRILVPGRDRIIVTLLKPRTFRVLVLREDGEKNAQIATGGAATIGSNRTNSAKLVELRAYENDVLHALTESGGLPGLDAKDEITILRGSFAGAQEIEPILQDLHNGVDITDQMPNDKSKIVTRIPLRVEPGQPTQQLSQEDVILNDGDIVYIRSRDAEVFYTGGLIQGGQHPIPRDFDLDVLGAMAMAGGSIAASAGGGYDGRGAGVGQLFPPTRVLVLRMVNGQQQVIKIDLKKALRDPTNRILVEPNDLIVLEYTSTEVMLNTALSMIRLNLSLDSLFN